MSSQISRELPSGTMELVTFVPTIGTLRFKGRSGISTLTL